MTKGKKGGKGRRHGDDEDDHDEEEATTQTTTPANSSNSKMSFAERRQFQRQQAADKRRSKMKCHLCGHEGHVRRECPGLEDDGQGESKYKNAKGDAGAKMNTAARSKKGAKNRGRNAKSGDTQAEEGSSGMELPPGFDETGKEEDHKEEDHKEEEKEEATETEGPFVYYDASCDVAAILEYVRTGRSKAKRLSAQEALNEYQQVLEQQQQVTTASFGGCLSRSILHPNRPWVRSTQEEQVSKLHPVWHVIGLGHEFLCQSDNDIHEGDSKTSTSAAATQTLVETISSDHTQQEEPLIVGLMAELNYAPAFVSHSGCDRPAQLRRLRATLAAAHQSNDMTVQIRVSPGAPTDSSAVNTHGGGTEDEHNKDDPYDQVMADLTTVLKEILPKYPNLKVHLSCWTGTPAHMNQLLQAFSSPQQQIWIGMDATVTFAKASLAHECAFDIDPTHNLVLETGRPSTIPSTMTRALGRDAFGHAAYSIPWIAQGVTQHRGSSTGRRIMDARALARAASANTVRLYPGILQRCPIVETTV